MTASIRHAGFLMREDAMQSMIRTRGATLAGLLVLALAALTPSLAEAKPEAGARRGFRLFARPLGHHDQPGLLRSDEYR